jgi:hypothetical protein
MRIIFSLSGALSPTALGVCSEEAMVTLWHDSSVDKCRTIISRSVLPWINDQL